MLQRVLVITKRKSIVASFQRQCISTLNQNDPLNQSSTTIPTNVSKNLDKHPQQKQPNARGIAVKDQEEEFEREKERALNGTPPAPGNADEVNQHFIEKEQHEAEEVQQHEKQTQDRFRKDDVLYNGMRK